MNHSTLILATFALALSVVCVPRSACATVLACQANATSDDPPTMTRYFTALAGDGTSQCCGFLWEFGDGGTSTEQNPEHTYAQVGIYKAVLTVTDAGSQESCSDTVRIVAGLVERINTCSADASVRWGQAPLSVTFSANPHECGPGPPTWTWRFGDGQFSSEQSVVHEYSEPGTFWAVATQHTATGSCDCHPGAYRITALKSDIVGVAHPARDGGLRLEPARPNPFGLMTTIAFDLPRPGHARLTILDVYGRTVAELVNDFRPAGPAVSIWQGRAATGRIAPPGHYIVRLEHEGVIMSTRLVRMR